MGEANGGPRSQWLSLTLALVPAVVLPQGPDALVGPVCLALVQLMEPSPLVQFEPCGIFFPPERILCLHVVAMGGGHVVLPVQEGGIRPGRVRRAVWALPLGLHPGESILARRQALPLAVTDASTPSAWNGSIHPLIPTGFYGGPRPPPGVAGISAAFPLLFLALSLACSARLGAATTVWRPAS